MNKKELLDKESQSDDLILLEFYADWCPHCQRMKPVVDEFETKMKAKVPLVFRINIDEEEELANSYDVDSIPTFILMRKGKQLWRQSGELSLAKLEDMAKV